MKRFLLPFFLFFLTLFSTTAQLPAGFTDVKIHTGYVSPMGVIFSNNGLKMFVWEKSGFVWVSNWNGTSYIRQAVPILNLSEEVADWRDFGLESLALDPNFDANGLVYLFYQVDRHHLLYYGTPQYNASADEYFNASISRLTSYQLLNTNGNLTANLASRKILLGETKSTGVPLVHESHAGGQILFGADGTLLVTTGDNASYASSDMGSASETFFQQAINDGILRITENVGSFRAQQINSFCGKLLRLDPNTGDAIPSNPYYDAANPRSAKSRVWALGLRNPYRMSFKTGTGSTNPAVANPGTLIVGDVQNGTWEEIHILERGGLNCGWPLFEGITPQYQFYNSGKVNPEEVGSPTFLSLCQRGGAATINNPIPSQRRFTHAAPALDYGHLENSTRYVDYTKGSLEDTTVIGTPGAIVVGTPFSGTCVTAGTYYTGTAFPPPYRNVFFFADYGTNWIKAISIHDNESHQIHEVIDFAPDGYGKGIVDLEYCPRDGSIFYVNINTGDIQQITYGLNNNPPTAVISADRVSGTSPLTVNFSSNGSFDLNGSPLTYNWDFGDGTANSALPNPTHTFVSAGSKGFIVSLTVADNQGLTDTKTIPISTNNTPPSVKINNPVNNSLFSMVGASQVNLSSTITDNDATGMLYAWQVTLRHNTHEHSEPIITQQSPTVQISPVGCDGETYYYLIGLTVTDQGGLTAKDSVKIYPDCSSASFSVSNLIATPQNNAVTLNWTNPSVAYDEIMLVAKANSGFSTKPSGTNYNANTDFTGNGTDFESGKIIYRSTGTNTTVTSLTAGTRYYFRVFTRKGTNWTAGIETSAVPTGGVVNPQLGCLKASYFNNTTLSGTPAVVRGETSINNSYVYDGPVGAGVGVDNFSVRWEGTVIPPTTGSYTFTVTGDDGVRLWVNNVLIIDKWFDQSATTYSAAVVLTQNQNVPIKLEYYEGDGRAFAKLFWTIPNQTSQPIAFTPCAVNTPPLQLGCLKASYFNNTTLSGTPIAVRGETSINNEYVYGAPSVSGIGIDNFSVRWEGTVIPPTTGTYTFTVTGDDGVRLWVNNVLIIDKWFDQSATTYSAAVVLTQNQNVPIKLEYYEGDGRAFAKLFWAIPNQASQVTAFTACAIAPPTVEFDPNKCYKLVGLQSGKAVEVPNSALTNGAGIEQRTYNGTNNQIWRIKDNGDNTYRFINGNSGKVIEIPNASTLAYQYAQQTDWNSGSHQRFALTKHVTGAYKLLAQHSGLPLEVQYSNVADGTRLWQSVVSGTYAQLFNIQEVGCPVGIVASASANILTAKGYREGKKAVITWVSDANASADYFMVQKLNSASVFEKHYLVNAKKGSTNDKNYYTIEDPQPTDGDNIYRVALFRDPATPPQSRGVEIPQYSELISLNFSNLSDFMLFPNPSNDYVDIDLETVRYHSVDLSLTDASGKVLQHQKIASAPIAPVRLNLEGLPVGQYFVRIAAEGKREVVKKLMIVR